MKGEKTRSNTRFVGLYIPSITALKAALGHITFVASSSSGSGLSPLPRY